MTMELEEWMKMFAYAHLPEHLQAVSREFHLVAKLMCDTLPNNHQLQMALQKLVEAKDCAVRARLIK